MENPLLEIELAPRPDGLSFAALTRAAEQLQTLLRSLDHALAGEDAKHIDWVVTDVAMNSPPPPQ